MSKPNVILLVADQLRYDMLGRGLTPNIDELIQNSVRMERAYCASPLCVPARGALFTGMYPNSSGSLINPWCKKDAIYGNVHKGIDTLYEMMERNGWDCLHSGKQHLFTEGEKLENRKNNATRWLSTEKTYRSFLKEKGIAEPGGEGFRSVIPEMEQGKYTHYKKYSNANTGCYKPGLEYYFDGYFTNKAIEGLRSRNVDKPLFFSGMFLAPHPPLEIPEPFFSRVEENDVSMPENVGIWYEYQSPLQLYNLTGIVGTKCTMSEWHETWRVYMGLVALLDACVGRIIDELKSQNLYENSLIIFTTDHGEMLGSHQLFQKMCMYEESVRAPVYIRFPNDEFANTRIVDPVSHIDVFPTICEYLGVELKNRTDGVSLLAEIKNRNVNKRPVYIQYDGNGARGNFQRCVIFGQYKLIVDIFKDEIYYELYDIENDVQEKVNLLFADDPPIELAQSLVKMLEEHMRHTNDMISLFETDLEKFIGNYKNV